MKRNNVTVEVLVNDKPVHEYFHNENHYIEGRKGSTFKLRIMNHQMFNRVLVIPSVDGLSVVNGELASEDSPGYIINPLGSIEVDGWRIDNKQVSKFLFGDKKDGYASKTDQSGHEGSIGLIVYEEVVRYGNFCLSNLINNPNWTIPPYNPPPFWFTNTSDARGKFDLGGSISSDTRTFGTVNNCSTTTYSASIPVSSSSNSINIKNVSASTVDDKLAVGHGDVVKSEVTEVTFNKNAKPLDIFVFYYDSRKGLEKRGIKISSPPEIVEPNPFPASTKYCKTPKGGW